MYSLSARPRCVRNRKSPTWIKLAQIYVHRTTRSIIGVAQVGVMLVGCNRTKIRASMSCSKEEHNAIIFIAVQWSSVGTQFAVIELLPFTYRNRYGTSFVALQIMNVIDGVWFNMF